MRNTFISTLNEIASENPKVWLLCGDLGYSVLEPFATRFPNRFVNVGVAEQNMAGMAAGIALSGNTVFIYSIGNFSTLRCLEQIRNDVCYHRADVKVVAVGSGFAYGSQGYTHHAIEDVAVMSALPGMEVFTPCDPNDVRAATRYISTSGSPSYLRLSRSGEPNFGSQEVKDFQSYRTLRDGRDVLILASGPIVSVAMKVAEILLQEGIDCRVLGVTTMKPFPSDLRHLVKEYLLVITIEEAILRGGLHATIASELASESARSRVLGFGIPEPTGKITFAGDRDDLLQQAGLSADNIAHKTKVSLTRG